MFVNISVTPPPDPPSNVQLFQVYKEPALGVLFVCFADVFAQRTDYPRATMTDEYFSLTSSEYFAQWNQACVCDEFAKCRHQVWRLL